MAPIFNTLFRHRGLYFSNYQAAPSFRDIAGYDLMLTIPRESAPFETWLQSKRKELDDRLGTSGVAKRLPYGGNYSQSEQMITETRPDFGRTCMDWTYELDLDTLVFSFMAEPMFRLDRIPPPDECERYITQDHYGLWACSPDVPEDYSYRTKWIPMPDQLHSAPVNIQMNVPLDDLVGPCVDRPDSERVCTRLYEVIIGQFFREYHHGFQQCSRPGADDDSEDAEQLRTMLLSLLWPAMTTMIYKSESQYKIEAGRSRERRWPSNDLFFQVCVGIRSEASLRSVAMKLLSEDIDDAESDRAIGVLFSGEHLAIVCFDGLQDASPESRTASCSPLLRFLPDRFGTSPSTPGINALVRLGQSPCAWLDYSILYRLLTDIDPAAQVPGPLHSFPPPPGGGPLMNLPHELLSQIVDHLDDNDLLNFAAVSEQTNIAVRACRRIRYPVIDRRHRLVKVRPLRFQPQVLPNGAVLRAEEFHELVAAAFVTEDDKVLLLGFNPADYALYLMISWTKCWGSGTLTMPYVLGRQIRIPYVVLDKDVVVDLENDATTDDLLGRISRRGTRIMDQYYQYRRGAEHPAEDDDL